MNNDSLSTLLTETEGGDRNSLDTVSLNRSRWVQDVLELLHNLVNIVGVSVTRNDTTVQDLDSTVQHPGTSSTLWMTSQVLLENTKDWVTLRSTQVLHHSINGGRLVLIVGLGRSTVERSNSQVIDGQTVSGQGSSQWSNSRVTLVEVVTPLSLSFGNLLGSFSVDFLGSLTQEVANREFGTILLLSKLGLLRQVVNFGFLPRSNLLQSLLQLSCSVLDVQHGRWVLQVTVVLTSSGQDTLTWSWNRSSNLVGGSRSHGQNSVNWNTHLDGQVGSHDKLNTRTLSSMKPFLVVVVGLDISDGVLPWANSSRALEVAFMLANS